MNIRLSFLPAAALLAALAACSGPDAPEGRKVEASGKEATALDAVPAEVVAVAMAAHPDLDITAAEYELRNGNEYYDLGGTLPDGSELELDMTRIDGAWTVVEFQRDISMDLVPDDVALELAGDYPDFAASRIIESDQGNGIVIYEFFGPADGDELVKHEVKWQDGEAETLVDEWEH